MVAMHFPTALQDISAIGIVADTGRARHGHAQYLATALVSYGLSMALLTNIAASKVLADYRF